MSDDERHDGMEDVDEEAQYLGDAQAFDAATGMPVSRAQAAGSSARTLTDAEREQLNASSSSNGSAQANSGMSDVETWHLSLAEKNQSNTQDLKVPHMLGIDEAGRGPVLGQSLGRGASNNSWRFRRSAR